MYVILNSEIGMLNASLLDESTAAAEAMSLSFSSFGGKRKKYFVVKIDLEH